MDDSGIQHKRTFTAPPGSGFGDAGDRVRVDNPQESDEPGENKEEQAERLRDLDETQAKMQAYILLLARLISGNPDDEQLARRVWSLAYLLRENLNGLNLIGVNPPLTQEELCTRINVETKGGASKIVNKLKAELMNELGR
jgi:hypothetical protein